MFKSQAKGRQVTHGGILQIFLFQEETIFHVSILQSSVDQFWELDRNTNTASQCSAGDLQVLHAKYTVIYIHVYMYVIYIYAQSQQVSSGPYHQWYSLE